MYGKHHGQSKRKDICATAGTGGFQFCYLFQVCPSSQKNLTRESTTEKNYNSLETVPDFYANDMLRQHFRYIHVETCLFLSAAQVGDALGVALLPELLLLDRELLGLV